MRPLIIGLHTCNKTSCGNTINSNRNDREQTNKRLSITGGNYE